MANKSAPLRDSVKPTAVTGKRVSQNSEESRETRKFDSSEGGLKRWKKLDSIDMQTEKKNAS